MMKLKGYTVLMFLLSLLLATASYGQENQKGTPIDSVKVSVEDYTIFCECCIKQTYLESDTSILAASLRHSQSINKKQRLVIKNLNETNNNTENMVSNMARGMLALKSEIKTKTKKIKWLNAGLIILPPVALIGGFYIGSGLTK